MKKLVFPTLFLALFWAGCTKKEEGLAQLDETKTVYEGNLFITGKTDLSALKNVTIVDGSVTISDEISQGHPAVITTAVVKDISALKNLKRITGSLTIGRLSELKSLDALGNVENIDGDIYLTPTTLSLSDWGMPKLKRLKNLRITGLIGALSFKNLGTNLEVENLTIEHSGLDSISDMSSLANVTNLNISNNQNLKSIGNMLNMTIKKQVSITSNEKLARIGVVKSISAGASVVLHTLAIENLDMLSNTSNLMSLSIQFCKNMRSINLSNFTNLTVFTLTDSRFIKSIDGFQNCRKGTIILINNSSLENINELGNLTNVRTMHIVNNPNLKSIASLTGLGEENVAFSSLNISDNINLMDLCPIARIVKTNLKLRQTNVHVLLPVIKDNGVTMTLDEMIAKCP
jgi:hypothetical protein